MIGKANRFHGYNSLRFVYQNGQTVRGPLMSLRYCENKHRSSYRLAVVVSKKVSKSAVTRNKIRRRLYEAVRLKSEAINKPYDLVVTVFNESLVDLPNLELGQRVTSLLAQAHVIIEPKETTDV